MPSIPSTLTVRRHPARRLARLAVGLALGIGLTLPAAALPDAQPAMAGGGGSCTGWNSTTRPPKTIRVLRSWGRVEVVDFKRYVIVVTAKEWPSYIPYEAIETGATAVKQYGWIKTLAGNHRSSFVTPGGKCYDVVDGTRDQLYKPHLAKVTAKIRRAVDAIWGLSLRKDGRFFETGYRTGTSRRCGRDADGRLLYARSVIDCARRGMSRQQIQFRYYGRNLTLHWSDGRVISAAGQSGATSTSEPAQVRAAAYTPKPAARHAAQARPVAAATSALKLPKVGADKGDGASTMMIWLPGSPVAGGRAMAPAVALPTVYFILDTLLRVPLVGMANSGAWPRVCATSVGALPVGDTSYFQALPPPFGCANPTTSSAAMSQLSADRSEPVLAGVNVDVERGGIVD